MTDTPLAQQSCQPRKGAADALDADRIQSLLATLPGWEQLTDGQAISKDFSFKNFYQTLGFVNAVGWMANQQDHHPDLDVGYGHCRVTWSTHDVGGLSLNDFICAARVDAIHGG